MRILFFLLISIAAFGQNVGTLPNSITPIDTASYTLLAQPSATTLRKLSLNRLYNTMPLATGSVSGRLSSSDWTLFNGKESALTFSSPLSRSVNTISIPAATTSVNGYLTSSDWNTFNTKVNSNQIQFVTPEEYGAIGDGSTNDQAAIQNAVNSGKPVYFGQKNYRVTSTISIPDGVKLIGSGNGSIISTTSNISILTFAGSDITVDNLTLTGNKTGASQRGIDCQGNVGLTLARNNNMVSNVRFKSLTTGLYVSNMNLVGLNYGGIKIVNSIAFDCTTGYFNDARGEYTNYSNCVAIGCVDGWTNNAGNNNWVGGQLTNNTTGVRIGAGTNDGHAVISGAMINHNTTNVSCISVTKNYLFLGCMIYAGNIFINLSDGIKFSNCEFSTITTFTNTSSTGTEISNSKFETLPPSFTGTTPLLFNNTFATGLSPSTSLSINELSGELEVTGLSGGNILNLRNNSASPILTLSNAGVAALTGSLGISGTLSFGGNSGSSGQVLTSNGASTPSWTTPFANPMTTQGDLILGGASGSATRLGIGSNGQVLTSNGTTASWQSGLTDPMTTRGDLIIRNSSNVTARLGVGPAGTFLSSDGTDVSWATPSGSGSYYAPNTLVANATDANFTATVNGIHNILDGVATANRVITIPTGANGDVMKFYNTEDFYTWSFTGGTVYLADRVTVVTQLLYNVPCFMEKIDGRWIITN